MSNSARNDEDAGGHEVPAGNPGSDHLELNNLVKQYFNICNAALTHGGKGGLYDTLLTFLGEFATGETIVLEVTDTREGEPEPARYTTRFVDGQFTPIREGTHSPEARFSLSREFLEDVERNSRHYLEHPEDLDWGWLRGKG